MPIAPSPAQSAASRLNGARSHGPVTDEGKATSSANATRHGICSARLDVDDATAGRLAWHVAAMTRDWLPQDEFQERLVHDLAIVQLKLARLDALELRALDAAMEGADARLPSLGSLARYRRALRRDEEDVVQRLMTIKKVCAEEELEDEEDMEEDVEPDDLARMNEPEPRRPTTGPMHGLAAARLLRAGIDLGDGG